MIPLSPARDTRVTLQPIDPPGAEVRALSAWVISTQGRTHTLGVDDDSHLRVLDDMGEYLEMVWATPDGDVSVPVTVTEIQPASGRIIVETAERRSHTRVDSSLLFRCGPLSQAESAEMGPRILSRPSEYLEEDSDLDRTWAAEEMLDRLDSVFSNFHRMLSDLSEQVAHLVALQEGRASHVAPDLRCRVINISGAGLAFECQEALAPGTMLRMTFDLQRFPYRSILCLGDVVRRQSRPADASPTTPHLIFAHFTHIREEDRDRIIHYVFKMQRRMLRSRRQKAVAET